jgi:hypothetical protein
MIIYRTISFKTKITVFLQLIIIKQKKNRKHKPKTQNEHKKFISNKSIYNNRVQTKSNQYETKINTFNIHKLVFIFHFYKVRASKLNIKFKQPIQKLLFFFNI